MKKMFSALSARSPVIAGIVAMLAAEQGVRYDANETTILSNALVAAGIEAINYDYPELKFREFAPVQSGIDAGAESYTWQEYDITGQAKVIANGSDDLPDVSAYMKTNTGVIKNYGNSYSFTRKDLRRVAFAKRSGQQAGVLDVDRIAIAREMHERTKDYVGAYGDTARSLPGVLKGANVNVISAAAPAAGSSKKWDGVDKTGAEILKDLRTGMKTVAVQSKGAHRVNKIGMSIEFAEAIAVKPLLATGDNQITVLEHFLKSQRDMGQPVTIVAWNRCATADAAGTGDRVVFGKVDRSTAGLVEPLPFDSTSPEQRGLGWKVGCESEYGGIFIKKPLAWLYMDFV